MIKVAIEFVDAAFAKLADLGMKEKTICVRAVREKFADRRVRCDAYRFVVLNRNN